MEIRSLKPLMMLVIILVVINALRTPAILALVELAPAFFNANITPIANDVDLAARLFKIVTMIVFSVWIYQAGRNLIALGYEDLSFTPGARIWWFAIPFANLVQPYLGMRELWNASQGNDQYDDTVPLVAIWWGLWLAHGFMGIILQFFVGADALTSLWLQSALDFGLAGVAIQLLRGITNAQSRLRGPELSQVFA
ncbi:DUF4328 domain-containing protein [Nostoc ellipsosporum NOK]|uniref:DUF4328 domain-containing protein n=1 Tax=Sphingomonas sp. IBVSS2 TaxID=1985172 RepID=UPI0015C4F594|nr:DUF4328 domain-containing protein [Sphingomonas sp. IBVSS2]MDF2383381.1 DUF4328 domain-containing protein [Nostoc ellipsosporum NOK]